uniref:Putative ovule protein n=1 Tax=Solanum chacoense TaxID=4108 RepID=A0A0V0H4S5_SOLCH
MICIHIGHNNSLSNSHSVTVPTSSSLTLPPSSLSPILLITSPFTAGTTPPIELSTISLYTPNSKLGILQNQLPLNPKQLFSKLGIFQESITPQPQTSF